MARHTPDEGEFSRCLGWSGDGISQSEAAERLALLVKHHLLKMVDEPGFGGRRYRMHGLVLRCIRYEAGVDLEDKRTFAWVGQYEGLLFDRPGWWRSVFDAPSWPVWLTGFSTCWCNPRI